jgi:hypothetical protein
MAAIFTRPILCLHVVRACIAWSLHQEGDALVPPHTLARYYRRVLFGLSAITMSASASTPDGFAVGYGVDESGLSVDAVQVAATWNWGVQWLQYENWHLDGY